MRGALRSVSAVVGGWWLGIAAALAQQPVATTGPRDAVHQDLQYGDGVARDGRRNSLDLYVPGAAVRPPVVMFVHGGAWTGGQKEHGAGVAHGLVAHGIAVACINTRMFPFAKPAAMVDDCGRALAWLHRHAAAYGCDGERLILMGHSAGGHLVSWLALDDARLAACGVPRAALRGAVALSGVHELRVRHPLLEPVFGSDLAARASASPFAHASAGDPPMFLVCGEHDLGGITLCSRMLRDRLRERGVAVLAEELAGRDHVDYFFALAQPRNTLLQRIVAFVKDPPAAGVPAGMASPAAPERRTVQLPRGERLEVFAPAGGTAAATVLWLASGPAEQALAASVGAGLVRGGIATVCADAAGRTAAEVAELWRRTLAGAAAFAVPAPAWFGGAGKGGDLVAAAPLRRSDGLLGRVLAGADLPAIGNLLFARVEQLAAGGPQQAPALLLLQGDGDPPAVREPAAHVAIALAARRLDVHLVQVAAPSAAALLRDLAGDDVLLPMLRAFVRP